MKFSPEAFSCAIINSIGGYGLEEDEAVRVQAALRELFSETEDDEREMRKAVAAFEHDGFTLSDIWEISGREYCYRFIWNLYAIVWAIQQYDYAKRQSA